MRTIDSIHPTCPDRALQEAAAATEQAAAERHALWSKGFNRRRLLKGGLGVGVAALGAQLVSTRVSYAAPSSVGAPPSTLVVIFLRGGMDGLSVVVPAEDPDLLAARPGIAVRGSSLIPLTRGFGLHPSLAPLKPWIDGGSFAAVPAVSTPDLSRSHFQAQDCLERGGASTAVTRGWLDRVIEQTGPGTTFRSVAVGGLLPRSMSGPMNAMGMRNLASVKINAWPDFVPATQTALEKLYTGLDHPLATQAMLALDAVDVASGVDAAPPAAGVTYPTGDFAAALKTVADLIKARTGVRVATVDVGGWDMHTGLGTVASGDMTTHLRSLADALAAFAKDLGTLLDTTTVVTMSEFGRRVQQNANAGTDHGHGGVVLALGGGVNPGVQGRWVGLASSVLDQGDVPGSNDYRDVLGEVVTSRFGLTKAQVDTVFPGRPAPTPVGLMR